MESKVLKIKGFKYSYKVIENENSEFNPIFIINGAFQNKKSWDQMIFHLKSEFTIIVADLPGWGKSDTLPSHYNFEFYNDFIDAILINEAIKKVNLISSSYGSCIAVSFAKKHTFKIEHLILCSPLLKFNLSIKKYYPKLREIIKSKNTKKFFKFLCKMGLINCEIGNKGKIESFELLMILFERKITNMSSDHFDKFLQNTERILKFGNADLCDIAHLKTFVLTGEYDIFTTPDDCKKVADSFDSSRIKLISHSDHLFLFERPKNAAEVISRFINSKPLEKYFSSSQELMQV